MPLHNVTSKKSRPQQLPENLAEGFDPRDFLGLVYDAVHSVEWPRAEAPAASLQDPVAPAMLRTLLTYCYATGVYCSHEIESATLADPSIRYICAHQRPTWPIIRRFRRQNLPWLRQALLTVCEKVAKKRCAGLNPQEQPSLARFTMEVERRLRKAIQADSIALDE